MDVEDLTFVVLDQDQTPQSHDYITAVSGSRYFLKQPPVATMAELEQRMKSGELSLVPAIPPGFGKNLKRGRPTEIAVWVDGAMPFRGETILGYMQGLHFSYLKDLAQRTYGSVPALTLVTVEARYRYNQDFRSLDAMVPAVIPILLTFIPAILMTLGIVREKELGSITNLYVTPVNRLEFLLGKQLPYIGFRTVSYASLVLLAFVLMAFTLMVYTAGSVASMELHNAPVVDEDQSALAGHMIDSLQSPWFMPADQIQYGQIDEVLDKGSHTFVLVIPDGFERNICQGRVTSVQLNIDATRMTQAFIGSRHIEQLLTTEVAEFMRTGSAGGALPINLVTRVSFNPNLHGTWFGGVMELITMISIILTGAARIREREHGTVEHLMVMPIKPFEIMVAKVWANGLVVMLAAILSVTLVIQQILDVPVQGSIWLFMFGTLIHLFSTTAIGILIGTVARTMPQFGLLLILTILPLQMLSGGITPRESMPE
ncbi:ABC transporter permease [Marinobacter sp. ELB17]|uniref:ABC transporter permease n=1 Tax=Marinobacter sp. ELB17 TaxID=270374 RepID=UPI0000F3721D|nr:ABC transporter permease [Marinobacter sp. ELB17]EAZ97985.1 ABC-type multidrug transport system, permease component [Marinobacter sp. ELB17]